MMRAVIHARSGPRFPVVASGVAALVLLAAAALKGWAMLNGAGGPAASRAIDAGAVVVELAMAGWLLSRPRSRVAVACAAGLFFVFSLVNVTALLRGLPPASCGCFGRLAVPPAITLRLDAGVLALLGAALVRAGRARETSARSMRRVA